MSRNDIRLRRKTMTSRKIENHKDYSDLLTKYKRGNLAKRIYKWAAVVLIVIIIVYISVFVF